ncbi:hypothetical protein D3C87_1576120 [compost metagenome]
MRNIHAIFGKMIEDAEEWIVFWIKWFPTHQNPRLVVDDHTIIAAVGSIPSQTKYLIGFSFKTAGKKWI